MEPGMQPGSEARSRSPSRSSFLYPYTKSEFGFDNVLTHYPLHDLPRHSHYFSSGNESRTNETSDLRQMKSTNRSSSQRYSSSDRSKYRHRKSSASPSSRADLRRKSVFILQDEIRRSPSTTILEEITDIDRITAMCMTTLKSMMDNKKYRKYVHHMNNNNILPWYTSLLCIGAVVSYDDLSAP